MDERTKKLNRDPWSMKEIITQYLRMRPTVCFELMEFKEDARKTEKIKP